MSDGNALARNLTDRSMSRAEFLQGASLAGAALLGASILPGCASSADKNAALSETGNIDWDYEADVVVLGGGGTGLAAAVEALTAGSSVILFEKDSNQGGTTALSGAVVQAAGTDLQKEHGVADDTSDLHAECWIVEGEGRVDEELVRDLAAGAPDNLVWLTDTIGVPYQCSYGMCHVPYVSDDLMRDRIHTPIVEDPSVRGGRLVCDAIFEHACSLGLEYYFDTEATQLITNEDGEVIGVAVISGSQTEYAKARQGVVIATSGIDRNEEMARELSPQQYWNLTNDQCTIMCAPLNTGDGIRMGMELGAGTCGFNGSIDCDNTTYIGTNNVLAQTPCILVNGAGRRFVCEDATYGYVMRATFQQQEQLQAPTYMIMDHTAFEIEGTIFADSLETQLADGRLIEAVTIEELAEKLEGVNAKNVVRSFNEWNEDIRENGADTQFGRDTWLIELNNPPYYAYESTSRNMGSIGGLKIDIDAHVLDTKGNVIPRLYAGGLATGGWIGNYYPGSGTGVMGAIHFGRKAGMNAAAEQSWE